MLERRQESEGNATENLLIHICVSFDNQSCRTCLENCSLLLSFYAGLFQIYYNTIANTVLT